MFIFHSFGNALTFLLKTFRLTNHSQLSPSHMCTSASSFRREPTRMEDEFHWIERNAETSVLYLTSFVFAQYVLLVQTPKNKFSQQIVLIITRYYKLPSYHWASKTTWFWGVSVKSPLTYMRQAQALLHFKVMLTVMKSVIYKSLGLGNKKLDK